MARIDLVEDFAIKRIEAETPESFHKIDIDDVIQVYMDLFGTDPADDIKKNRGGMMNINDMIRPLGYKEGTRDGTLVGDEEKKSFSQRIYNMLAPNEKESDEQLRLQGINPSSVPLEERSIAKNNPEGILQGLAREILGIGKKAEGSTLVDFIKSKRSRLMSEVSGEMMGNIFGTGVNEDKIKILKIEIDKLTKQLEDLGEN
tara:strand:- start:42 stop:647 length:606 start_codon:yes stop_codon:yes gene_type:complete